MKWFWIGLWTFLIFLVTTAAVMRPDTVDATLAFVGSFLAVAAWTLFITSIVFVTVGSGIAAWVIVRKNQIKSLRQQDGHYPLQRVKLHNGSMAIIDPNAMIGPVLVVDRSDGTATEHEPAAGWQVQATIRAMVERTRTAQAMFQGDESRSSEWGSQHRGDRITAAAAKLIDGPRRSPLSEPPQASPILPPQAALPARIYTPEDALNLNTRTKLVMGADTTTGSLVHWDMLQAPHLRVHGKSQGSGKTNTIQTLAAGAVRTGSHLIVLDRRRFKDWGAFEGCAELIDTRDPRHFAQAVVRLCAIYQERDALLGRHGAPNIAALAQPPQRIVVAISEFGALCATAQAEGVLADVLYPLSLILREAGATGVHVLIEDQVVDQRWPRGISANAEPVTGYLPVNYGAAGGYYDAHKLAPYQFHFAGTVFGTWPMAAVLPMALARVQPSPAVVSVSRTVSRETFPGVSPEVDPPHPAAGNTGNTDSTDGSGDAGKWHPFIAEYMQSERGRGLWSTPARGVRQLARAMSRHETGSEAGEDSYVSVASKVAASIRMSQPAPRSWV